jgi:hypothetical protein
MLVVKSERKRQLWRPKFIYGSKLLKGILRKSCGRVWAGFSYLRIGVGGRLL